MDKPYLGLCSTETGVKERVLYKPVSLRKLLLKWRMLNPGWEAGLSQPPSQCLKPSPSADEAGFRRPSETEQRAWLVESTYPLRGCVQNENLPRDPGESAGAAVPEEVGEEGRSLSPQVSCNRMGYTGRKG